jgi:hypothetical protein
METMLTAAWNRAVGNWPGMPLKKGEEFEQTVTNFLPALNRDVPVKISVRFVDWVSCPAAKTDNRCAEMEMRTSLDPEQSKTGLGELMKTMIPATAEVDLNVDRVQVEEVIRLITEPGTLVPHRIDYTKTTNLLLSAEGKKTVSKSVEKIQEIYSYTDAAPPAIPGRDAN